MRLLGETRYVKVKSSRPSKIKTGDHKETGQPAIRGALDAG